MGQKDWFGLIVCGEEAIMVGGHGSRSGRLLVTLCLPQEVERKQEVRPHFKASR